MYGPTANATPFNTMPFNATQPKCDLVFDFWRINADFYKKLTDLIKVMKILFSQLDLRLKYWRTGLIIACWLACHP
jgi:hypothetical protein